MYMLLAVILITLGIIFVLATAVENRDNEKKGRFFIASIAIVSIMIGTSILTKLTMV